MTQIPSPFHSALEAVMDAKKMAAVNCEEVPINVRDGFKFRIAEAQRALPDLLDKLIALTVPDRLYAVFAEGDVAAIEKARTILADYDEMILDAGKLYSDLADLVEPAAGPDRIFNVGQFSLMVESYQDTASDLGLERLDPPEYKEAVCFTRADTINHIRSLVRTAAKDELLIRYLKKQITNEVVDGCRNDAKTPVFVVGVTSIEKPAVAALFSRSSTYDFKPGQVVDPDMVAGLFHQKKEKAAKSQQEAPKVVEEDLPPPDKTQS